MCVLPDDRICKFINFSISICRNTVHMPISVTIELINKKCVPILMYGLCGSLCLNDKIQRNAYGGIFQLGKHSPVSEIMYYCGVSSFDFLYDKTYLFAYKKIINQNDVILKCVHEKNIFELEGLYNNNRYWSVGRNKKDIKLFDNNKLQHLV